jgi:hypothetical protein
MSQLSGYIDPTYWYENSTDTGYLIWKARRLIFILFVLLDVGSR